MTFSPTRVRAAALAVAALAISGAVVAISPAATASTRDGASTKHPYSNPVWYPLRAASTLDCAGTNLSGGDCANEHNADHKVDWITGTRQDRKSVPVYAAGAGIVHVGDIAPSKCTNHRTNAGSRGTWLWIDHGGGTVSIYMHLNATSARGLSVRNGDYVTPRTRLGMSGNTGNTCRAGLHYLDFQIKHNAVWKGAGQLTGTPAAINTLRACYQGKRVNWPADLPGKHYATWHQTPKLTPIPNSNSRCIATSAPHTAAQPSGVKMHRGAHDLTFTWNRAAAKAHVTHVLVEQRVYHASSHGYTYAYKALSAGATRITFSKLGDPKGCQVRVAFYNHAGWSKWAGNSWV